VNPACTAKNLAIYRVMNASPSRDRPGGKAPPHSGATGLAEDLSATRRELLAGRHESYHRIVGALASLLAEPRIGPELLERFERAWRTRTFPAFYERPLLILATLRYDALEEGATHPLYGALAANPDPAAVNADSLLASLARERLGVWSALTTRRVQTNDTSRAVTWLWPAALLGCDQAQRPLAVVDIGAAAGLNLIADRLPAIWHDRASGQRVACANSLRPVARLGFDARPLDAAREEDVGWLRACIWPGDERRLERLDASVAAWRSAARGPAPPTLERLAASLVPARLAGVQARLPAGGLLLAFQSLLRGYLQPAEADSYRQGMLDLLLQAPAGNAAWVELELDDSRRRLPAAIVAHVRAANEVKSFPLARCSQHPSELEIDEAAVAALRRSQGSS
jgi:hypothetical protein